MSALETIHHRHSFRFIVAIKLKVITKEMRLIHRRNSYLVKLEFTQRIGPPVVRSLAPNTPKINPYLFPTTNRIVANSFSPQT